MEDKTFFLFKYIIQKVNDISIYRVEISPKGHHDKCPISRYIVIQMVLITLETCIHEYN